MKSLEQDQYTSKDATDNKQCCLLLLKLINSCLLAVNSLAGIGQYLSLCGCGGDGGHWLLCGVVVVSSLNPRHCHRGSGNQRDNSRSGVSSFATRRN